MVKRLSVWVYYGGGPQPTKDQVLAENAATFGGVETGGGCGLPDGMRDKSFAFKTAEKASEFAEFIAEFPWVDHAEEVA